MGKDYFAANDIAAFSVTSGVPTESNTAGHFNATYTSKCISLVPTASLKSARFIDPDTGASASLTDAWFHFDYFNFDGGGGANGVLVEFLNSAGTPVVRIIQPLTTTMRVDYWDGAAWVNGTVSGQPGAIQLLKTYDLHIVCGGAGSIQFVVDQSSQFTMNGLNAAVNNIAFIKLYGGALTNSARFSQFLVSDVSTVGAKVASLIPNANGANVAWANDYTKIVESGFDDATIINSASTGDKESYGCTDATIPASYSVSSLWFNVRARMGAAAPTNIKPLVRIGGVDYAGAYNIANLNNGTYEPGLAAFSLDPSTAAAWASNLTNVNGAELGFQAAA